MKTWIAVLVAGALMLAGAMGAKAYTDDEYDALVSYIEGIRDDPPNTAVKGNPVHIAKWNRVLAAIGADGQGEPAWPEATIHANADQWPNSPWKRPSDYLKWKAEQDQPQPPKPEITVTGGSAVVEGGDATFTVTATPAPAANLAVSVTVSASGDYGAATGTRTVTVPTSGSATFAVGTTDDSADEADGSVTATVNAGSDYTVSASRGAATVSVADNDDAPVPVVSVTGGSGVTEGGDATFTVTATPAPAANLAVSVTVSASGDYGAATGTRTVTVPAAGSATFAVATTDDSADETDGSVTATVNTGSDYTVSSTQGAATVSVSDDDDPSPDWTDYQTVVNYLIGIRDNPPNAAVRGNVHHIRKWNRVLEAVGYDTGTSVTPMAEATIHANADQWPDSPWAPPSTFLNWVEAQEQASQQGEDQDIQVQQQQQRFSHDCGNGVTVQEDENGIYVVTYPEGSPFVLCELQLTHTPLNRRSRIVVPDIDKGFWYLTWSYNPNLIRLAFGTSTTNSAHDQTGYDDDIYQGDKSKDFRISPYDFRLIVTDDESDPGPVNVSCAPNTGSSSPSDPKSRSTDNLRVVERPRGTITVHYPEGFVGWCDWALPTPLFDEGDGKGHVIGGSALKNLLKVSLATSGNLSVHTRTAFAMDDDEYTGDRTFTITDRLYRKNWIVVVEDDEDPPPPDYETAQQCIAQDADDDKVLFVAVTNGGSGYTSVPTVTITGGGGSGATGVASLGACNYVSGCVDNITLNNRGSGYTSAPTVTITGGGGSGATAQAHLPSGRLCGPGGHQVIIERETDDPTAPVSEGTPLEYFIYPSPPPMNGNTVKVKYTLSGRTGGDTNLSRILAIGKGGSKVTINPPNGTNDGNLHVSWSTTDGSNYRVHKDAMKDTVYIVDDDSLGWYVIPDTMDSTIYEGSPIKAFKIALDQRHSYLPETDPSNVLGIDFDISGCALSATPLDQDAEPVAVDAEIPCWIAIGGVGSGQVVSKASADEFEIRQWKPQVERTFAVRFQVGHDSDKTDETITINPTFTFNNSSGGFVYTGDSPFGTIMVSDDDKLVIAHTDKDAIYVLGDETPDKPTGGESIEEHTPADWSRDEPVPTTTKNVYRSLRSRNYDTNDVFTSAGSWEDPVKVLDMLPESITVAWTRNGSFSVSENNAPAQPVLSIGGSLVEIAVDENGSHYTSAPTVTITGGGGSGATATAVVRSGSVREIDITNPGEGYTSYPTVTITGGGGSGATARVTAIATDRLAKDYLIPYTIASGTATLGVDFWLDNDDRQLATGVIRLNAGLENSRELVAVIVENDNLHEGNETFTVTIGDLPTGVEAGAHTTATVTIIDDETAPVVETPSEALRFLGFTAGTQEIDEGLDLTVTGRFVSPVDFEGTLALNVGNSIDGEPSCLGGSGYLLVTDEAVTLTAGVITDVDLALSNSHVRFNGVIGDSSFTRHPKDEQDCTVLMSLSPYPRTVDENDVVVHPGYSVDADDAYRTHKFVIRDLDWTELHMSSRAGSFADNDRTDTIADFHVHLTGADGAGNSAASRNLERGEVVEFPVRAWRGTIGNNGFVKKTALPLDLWSISILSHASRPQTNASVRKLSDGYAVKWRNNSATDEENGPCANALGIVRKKHEIVCIDFKSNIPSDDVLWDEEAPAVGFEISSSAGKFGATNMNPGVRSSATFYRPIVKGEKSSTQADGNQFEIRPVGSTTVAEPHTGFAWVPFDVYAWRGTVSDFEPTGLAFCVDSNRTTASYYHDYTIYNESEYDVVSQFPQYARYISGYAWGNGQESCSRALAIPENGSRMYIRVLADSHDEGAETIRMKLVQRDPKPGGATIADSDWVTFTITNDGPIPRAWLARFGRTVGEQYLDAITHRFSAARAPGVQGRFAGHALQRADDANDTWSALDGRDDEHQGGHGSESITLQAALLNSSFSWTGAADDDGSLSVWGSAARTDFAGTEGALRLDGEVTTAMMGADYARGDWLVGFAAGHTTGDGGYRDGETADEGAIDTSMISVVPYTRWRLSEAWSAWAILGYGRGDMTLKRDGERMDAPIDWTMAATGVRTDLYATGATRLSLISDGMWARTSSDEVPGLAASRADVTRVRLGLEGSHAIVAGGGTFEPRAEVGVRHDGGDAETGLGVELGAGLAWSDPALGLSLDVSGRTLLAHDDDDLKDRGFSAALGFDPSPESARGPSLSLRQEFGARAGGGLDALFDDAPLEDRTGAEPESRWTAEAAWGFPALDGRWTSSPHAGLGLAPGARDWTLGWRWTPETARAPALSFGFKTTRRESDTAAPEHTVGFEAAARW